MAIGELLHVLDALRGIDVERTFYPRWMAIDLPTPVVIRVGMGSKVIATREHVGLLLEWKQVVVDGRGARSWRGLVVYAMPGVGKEDIWELRQRWMSPECLTPIVGRP